VKEFAIWAAILVVAALLVFVGLPVEAVGGTFAFVCFVAWIVIEFWNLTRMVAKISAWLVGEPAPGSVDRTMGLMDRHEREYAGTRNAAQGLRRGRRNG